MVGTKLFTLTPALSLRERGPLESRYWVSFDRLRANELSVYIPL